MNVEVSMVVCGETVIAEPSITAHSMHDKPTRALEKC
jgi:hypothetical protein